MEAAQEHVAPTISYLGGLAELTLGPFGGSTDGVNGFSGIP